MNSACSRTHNVNQAKQEVLNISNLLKRKPITDKQLLYIFNMVAIPRIEYRTQVTTLSHTECEKIAAPFRRILKNKLGLSITFPTANFQNNDVYSYRDLFEVQLQSKITNFIIQINDKGLLGTVTDIRLKQLQSQMWLRSSPLVEWYYDTFEAKRKLVI